MTIQSATITNSTTILTAAYTETPFTRRIEITDAPLYFSYRRTDEANYGNGFVFPGWNESRSGNSSYTESNSCLSSNPSLLTWCCITIISTENGTTGTETTTHDSDYLVGIGGGATLYPMTANLSGVIEVDMTSTSYYWWPTASAKSSGTRIAWIPANILVSGLSSILFLFEFM